MGRKGWMGRTKTVPGFTQGTAIVTGKYPDETNHFTWYRYSPKNSPFLWLKPFKAFRILPQFRFYDPIKVIIRKTTGLITKRKYPDPAHIPLDLVPYFENIGAEIPTHLRSLISICRSSSRRCLDLMLNYGFIGTERCTKIFNTVYETIKKGDAYDLYMIHVGELDILGHRFGPRPELFKKYLGEIDACIEQLYELAHRHSHMCNIVIVSDHGMYDVLGTVDIAGKLKQLKLRLHKDYIYFLDSTMARFWFLNDRSRSPIEEMLKTIPHGHIVSDDEKKEYHVNFKDNLYGDVIFWLSKGYIIFPNFFQTNNFNRPKGMHGYMDDEDGVLITYSDEKLYDKNINAPVPLTNVFTLVLDMMRL